MAEIVWTDPALSELEEIADYIALENPLVANELVQRVFAHAGQLADHPESGSKPQELKGWRYRQIIEPPCRIFCRIDSDHVVILYVMRSEKQLVPNRLHRRS